jgi:hypothetical protein
MSIDKQRITGVKVLEALGYTFANEWKASAGAAVSVVAEADRMHALLVHRADQLEGFAERSLEEQELEAIANAIEAYEVKRWPEGKVPGGKG